MKIKPQRYKTTHQSDKLKHKTSQRQVLMRKEQLASNMLIRMQKLCGQFAKQFLTKLSIITGRSKNISRNLFQLNENPCSHLPFQTCRYT